MFLLTDCPRRFPTIRDLVRAPYFVEPFVILTNPSQAASDLEIVNGLWKGLGYYSRAARLLSGAQKAVNEFGGRLPDNAKAMETIPGIGRYSAGAICSIAYNECVPVVRPHLHLISIQRSTPTGAHAAWRRASSWMGTCIAF